MSLYIKGWLSLGLIFSSMLFVVLPVASRDFIQEDAVKAAMLYNFVNFVEWQTGVSPDKDQPLVLGVIGEDSLRERLSDMAGIPERRMAVSLLPLKDLRDLAKRRDRLHILYIARSAQKMTPQILKLVSDLPILTICDDEEFVRAGGVMNFVRENSRIRFDINLIEAESRQLKLSAKLFGLARRIIRDDREQKAI